MSVGMGVMINAIFSEKSEEDPILPFIGKIIKDIKLVPDGDGELFIYFTDNTTIGISDQGRSCCEDRYITTDDKLSDFIGFKFLGAEIKEGPTFTEDWNQHEIQFLVIKTEIGHITLETHNVHNGYYGGFWLTVRVINE